LNGIQGFHEYSLNDIESVLNCGLNDAFDSILNGQIFQKNEHRCTNGQGHYAVLNLLCTPYRIADGSIAGFSAIVQDITKLSNQKSELEEAIYELSIMGQVSEALSSTSDLDNTLKIILTGVTANQGLGFNRAFLFLMDKPDENLIGTVAIGPGNPEEAGKIWSQLSQTEKTLTDLLNDYNEQENTSSITLTSLIKDWRLPRNIDSIFNQAIEKGQAINVFSSDTLSSLSVDILKRLKTENIAIAPIVSRGKKLGIIAADNQITGKQILDSDVQLLQTFANHTAVAIERSKMHEDIVKHAAQLEEKNRQIAESQDQIVRIEKMSVIGELTSSIAHELRNPLTVIGGFANLMLAPGNGGDINSEYLNIIISESKRAELVLNQVLDFSRSSNTENGKIDFNALVKATFELFTTRLKHNRKKPGLNQIKEKAFVWGNRDQLQHAIYQFLNLTVEEMTDECDLTVSTLIENNSILMLIKFDGSNKIKQSVIDTLGQIFDSSVGTQKLSIIVAGETIKYHGGSYGVMASTDKLPGLYIQLPLKGGQNHG
jgi:signal transduction histidine kinase